MVSTWSILLSMPVDICSCVCVRACVCVEQYLITEYVQ